MKKLFLVFAMVIVAASLFSQDITGKWNGVLVIPGGELRVDFNLSKTADGYTSTMDSPDQNAFGIPTTKTEFKDKELLITVDDLGVVYKAKLNEENVFKGTFTQMGQTFDMDLTKSKEE